MIDKIAKKKYNFFSFLLKRIHHEIATQLSLMRILLQEN